MTKILGNRNCKYSAHSPHVRCAVNPDGPCEGCTHFEKREGLPHRSNAFAITLVCNSSETRDRLEELLLSRNGLPQSRLKQSSSFAHARIKNFSEVLVGSCAIAFLLPLFGLAPSGMVDALVLGAKTYANMIVAIAMVEHAWHHFSGSQYSSLWEDFLAFVYRYQEKWLMSLFLALILSRYV